MDASRVLMLRELLASTGWVERTRSFARTIRRSTADPGGLLLVGTPQDEPWHLAAHLDDESRLSGIAEIKPTLIRYQPPADAPPHLSVTLARLELARRGETVFVVAETAAPTSLLERAWDARKVGATVVALESGDDELRGVAHESLTIPAAAADDANSSILLAEDPLPEGFSLDASGLALPMVSFDTVQHLVSVAAGETAESSSRGFRDRLSRLLETISGPRHSAD